MHFFIWGLSFNKMITDKDDLPHDGWEFLEIFKDGMGRKDNGMDNSFDDYKDHSNANTGKSVINQMIHRPQ
jgi:hypothetical protein